MIITVYQQVYVEGSRTRAHITIVNDRGIVVERRFANYEAYPLYNIARDNRLHTLKVIRRSMDVEKVIYDCNVQGRVEFIPKGSGYECVGISHPRFGEAPSSTRLIWQEPRKEENEIEEELTSE